MLKEKKSLELWGNENETYATFDLLKVADSATVKVFLLGERILPYAFDKYGRPRFTYEFYRTYEFKKEELARQNKVEYYKLECDVEYEQLDVDFDIKRHDTIDGIKKSLESLEDFLSLLFIRSVVHKNYDMSMSEFIVFGKYYLNSYGVANIIETNADLSGIPDVIAAEDFHKWAQSYSQILSGKDIPSNDEICTCCSEKFTIEDLKDPNRRYVCMNGKGYHKRCYDGYRFKVEVLKFSQIMRFAYDRSDLTYTTIGNGYCSQPCCSNIPWFIYHTPDGDIEIGWRKRVISIQWLDNYKEFSEDFASENVTKGSRSIHAWGEDKAIEYLKRARKSIIEK